MSDEIREGYYQDKHGNWLKDRRRDPDRRLTETPQHHHHEERRLLSRRKTDVILKRDHREMIEDALQDFAAEHDGHL
ncbi:MAG: hypothetical protein HZB26_02295 [Candidatus Hydrogenedentes bacterium]|nr:hypothetical protein [Candidatus Hydrogenedentota bacterium]